MTSMKKLAALIASGALLLGMMFASTGAASAGVAEPDCTVVLCWEGNGVENGRLGTEDCDENNTPYIYWVFASSNGVTSATIHFAGTGSGDFAMNDDNGTWKLQNGPWFELEGLIAWVTYTGTPSGGNPHLTISHGCPGDTTTTTTTTDTTTTTTTSDTTTTTTTTFTGDTGGETDAPSEPNTATIGTSTGAPADGAWLLVIALGVLLASIVVLTPAKARARR